MTAEGSKRRVNDASVIVLFAAIAVAWVALDRVTKALVDTVPPGTVLVENVLGLFEFKLVHNTGAAWGMFSNATGVLGVFSLLVCIAVACAVAFGRGLGITRGPAAALAFVFAGGLGNAFDRFAQGYVTDFINCTFIDFPVFNVADIGVTCGIIAFMALLLIGWDKGAEDGEAEPQATEQVDG